MRRGSACGRWTERDAPLANGAKVVAGPVREGKRCSRVEKDEEADWAEERGWARNWVWVSGFPIFLGFLFFSFSNITQTN